MGGSIQTVTRYFNPLPPCGGRPVVGISALSTSSTFQSTPSVRRETHISLLSVTKLLNFNPLPPCGGRLNFFCVFVITFKFQSTPSVRRETCSTSPFSYLALDFNPLPPCGGRRFDRWNALSTAQFQSTPSVRRETSAERLNQLLTVISIHSLRAEGDQSLVKDKTPVSDFNPLPPCGGRPAKN